MTETLNNICPACNVGTVAHRGGPGRFQWTRAHGYIPVPEDLLILTCDHPSCKAEWIDDQGAEALDAHAERWVPPPGWQRMRRHEPNCNFYPCTCGCIPDVKPTDRGTCTCWMHGAEEDPLPPGREPVGAEAPS